MEVDMKITRIEKRDEEYEYWVSAEGNTVLGRAYLSYVTKTPPRVTQTIRVTTEVK